MNFKTAVFALFMTVSMAAQGSWKSGGDLLQECESEKVYYSQGACMGYIEGVHDSAKTLVGLEGFPEFICIPQSVSLNQAKKVVVKYLNEHPEELHYDASSQVLIALMIAFPCKDNE